MPTEIFHRFGAVPLLLRSVMSVMKPSIAKRSPGIREYPLANLHYPLFFSRQRNGCDR